MKVALQTSVTAGDILFIPVWKKKWDVKPYGKLLTSAQSTLIAEKMKEKKFEGKLGEVLPLELTEKKPRSVFLLGIGDGKELADVRKAGGILIRHTKKQKAKTVGCIIPQGMDIRRIISGVILGNYEFKMGDTKERFEPKSFTLFTTQKLTKAELASEIAISEATNHTRDLVNTPSNHMNPTLLSAEAKKVGKGFGNKVKVQVLGEKELKKLKMGALLAVGQGAEEETRVVILEYKGGGKEKPLVLVGKGVCFDSGGYNLKPTGHIEEMKSDMAGAAAVISFFQWVAITKPKINITGVVGLVENMVSSGAFRPGDIITAMNGQTIEITNTDAEGRLVLADCIYYVSTKLKPAKIVDIATLTGAAIVALGHEITPYMGNDSALLKQIKKASESSDEMMWELPIIPLFREKIKGEISDLVNWTAGVSAGSPMGGAFVQNFVGKDIPWAHIDTAGTAFHKQGDEISPKGATGVMLRTLKALIEQQ